MVHIDHDAVVSGEIVVAGDVRLDGRCDGFIRCWRLEVGRWGRLEGNVEADEVVVAGEVIGEIRARRVRLAETAVVEGDVVHATLVVDGRAVLVGDSHRDETVRAPAQVRKLRERIEAEAAELRQIERAAMQHGAFGIDRGHGAAIPALE